MKPMSHTRIKRSRWLFLALLIVLTLWLGLRSPAPATAAFPGANGKIVFLSGRDGNSEIYTVNANGSDLTRLSNNATLDLDPAWSPDGTKIAFISSRDGNQEVYVMNAGGSNVTRLTNSEAVDFGPTWSPDGTKIAFSSAPAIVDANFDIYVMNADGSGLTNLTNNPGEDRSPAWSPDGSQIAFDSDRDGSFNDDFQTEIYVMNADGSSQTRLTNNPTYDQDAAWSPDGAKLVFESVRNGNLDIYVMNANGSSQTRLTNNPGQDRSPAWSPDGSQIAFNSDRDGNSEIYVMNAGGSGQTNVTNHDSVDTAPDWQPLLTTGTDNVLFLSATSVGTVGGVTFGVEDILRHDSSTGSWSLYFDGSDVGFSKAAASFTLKDDGSLLLTPKATLNLPGVGAVTPWDVVRFVPTSMGNNTAGSFQWYIDGSDVGLSAAAEKIDALEVLANGRVLVSTTGNSAVPKQGGGTLKSQDEDLIAFIPTTLGANTVGTWALHFNGTAITGLGAEDVVGAHVDEATGDLYLAILGAFNVGGVSGNGKDILRLHPTGGGAYTVTRYWRGGDHGFNLNLGGIEISN